MFEIIPSPGTEVKEWSEIEKRIEAVKPFAKSIHIDICDGKFAGNKTFSDPEPFKKYTGDIFFEVHLMVEEPINYIENWAAAGFRRFIGQIEEMSDQAAFVAKAEQLGEVGLAVDGPTSLEKLTVPSIDLDVVLIMAISAGFSGQKFQEEQLDKVRKLAEDPLIRIAMDGGINRETIGKAYGAGVRSFTVTSAIYNGDPFKNYQDLQSLVKSAIA